MKKPVNYSIQIKISQEELINYAKKEYDLELTEETATEIMIYIDDKQQIDKDVSRSVIHAFFWRYLYTIKEEKRKNKPLRM